MSSKKEILEKINKAKIVYIYNGHIDNYFKSSKSELMWHFRYLYKRQKTEQSRRLLRVSQREQGSPTASPRVSEEYKYIKGEL